MDIPIHYYFLRTKQKEVQKKLLSALNLCQRWNIDCIVEIFDAENVYTTDDVSTKELGDFVDNLTFPQIEKLGSYFDDMPKVFYDAEYTCTTCGTKQTRTMEGLQSFF